MTTKVLKQKYLPLLLRHFEFNSDGAKTLEKILPNPKNFPPDRVMVTHVHKLLAKKPYQKNLNSVVKLFEVFLQKCLKQYKKNSQKMEGEGSIESFISLVCRVEVLMKYSMPCESEMKKLEQILLFNSLSISEVISALSLLKNNLQQNESLKKISSLILALPPLSKQIHLFPLEIKALRKKTSNILHSEKFLTNPIFSFLSVQQLHKMALIENSLIAKRILFKLILAKNTSLQEKSLFLPGKQCQTEIEFEEAFKFITQMGIRIPFIDIVGPHFHKNCVELLTSNEFLFGKIVQYFFHFMSNGYLQLTAPNIKVFESIWQEIEKGELTDFFEHQGTETLLQLLILSHEIIRYSFVRNKQLWEKIIQKIVHTFNSVSFTNLKNSQLNKEYRSLKIICNFLVEELINILVNEREQKNSKIYLNISTVQSILDTLIKDSVFPALYTQTLQFINYWKTLKLSVRHQHLSILYSQPVSRTELNSLLQLFLDYEETNFVNTEKLLREIERSFLIKKNCIVQPNIKISYLLLHKQTKQILCSFDLRNSLHCSAYLGNLESREVKGNEGKLVLNRLGYWKCCFLEKFHSIKYQYCLSEEEFCLKVCQMMEVAKLIK